MKLNFFNLRIIILVIFLFFLFLAKPSWADISWVQTSQSDFQSGLLLDVDSTSSAGQLTMGYPTNVGENKWVTDTVIAEEDESRQLAKIVADNEGGAIIAWQDNRSAISTDIYAQKVNSSGTALWASNGVVISNASGTQSDLRIVTDGFGGAIITWVDTRGGEQDIYAQRINSAGTVQWTSNGIVVTDATSYQRDLSAIADGSGGAIITWVDTRNSTWSGDWDNEDIYAQRINSAGRSLWTTDGKVICTANNHQLNPEIASDGSNGAIISWDDYRSGTSYDVYAQKIDSSGTVQWTANGVAISATTNNQEGPQIIADGSNGAIIVWEDFRNSNGDIFAQKVNSSGTPQWTANGVAISIASGEKYKQKLVTDGSGGAIIAWIYSNPPNSRLYAQKIDSAGSISWRVNGENVAPAQGSDSGINIVSDNNQGAILAWEYNYITEHYVFAQKINSTIAGDFQSLWTSSGTVITVATTTSWYPTPAIAFDGSGGTIAVWQDTDTVTGIYAQKFGAKIEYYTSGTYYSPVYDAGSETKFSSIAWTENLPANTDLTFFVHTANEALTYWRDDFNDGDVSNVIDGTIAFPAWGSGIFDPDPENPTEPLPPTEPGGILTFINPGPESEYDDYYIQIDTGQAENYFPGGSTITARVKVTTEADPATAELYMFTGDWDYDSGYTDTRNEFVTISYTTDAAESFNKIGFDLYLLNHDEGGPTDKLEIDWINIELPEGYYNLGPWSAEMTNASGSEITNNQGRYIQYKVNFTSSDVTQTPVLNDVSVYMGLTGEITLTGSVDPELSMSLSSNSCDLDILSATDINTCSYNITVNTNGTGGYAASIRQDNDLSSGSNTITAVSGGIGTVSAGSESYGFATSDESFSTSGYYIPADPDPADCESYDGQHATDGPAKALSQTDTVVAEDSGPVSDDITTICHLAAIAGSTQAGVYSHTITVTVVGNY
ncbi:MAG: hypothetical protein NTZ49_00930 [Candidatus Parcubacteria bacterium]|nr:hypothetical protein [Candidatus Parcubacteria bacterium]